MNWIIAYFLIGSTDTCWASQGRQSPEIVDNTCVFLKGGLRWCWLLWRTSGFLLLLFSGSVMSDSLRPHGPQHARPPCPSPTPGVYSNSYPLGQWCYPIISSSVVAFSSCLQSFPASGPFPISQLFASGGQSTRALASVLPVTIQGWFSFRIDWFDLLAVSCDLQCPLDIIFQEKEFQAGKWDYFAGALNNFWPERHCDACWITA